MAEAAVTADPFVAEPVDYADVQGLVRFGHGQLAAARFLLMRVVDRDAARAWLAKAEVTTAVASTPLPGTALQVALTSAGLRAVGIDEAVIDDFSPEFVVGMGDDDSRARRLGDVGPNDPSGWSWGAGERVPHVLLMLYAKPEGMVAFEQAIVDGCAAGLALLASLDTAPLSEREAFGFSDGVSQPTIDWERTRPAKDETRYAYGNRVCLGEFLLGYPNEYGGYSDRPLLPVGAAALLPRAEDDPDRFDLGRNGSYLVLRQLRQDVRAFWTCLDAQAGGDASVRVERAEAMIGRTFDGESLIGRTDETIEGLAKPVEPNAFTYRSDPDGLRCPLGAHVRRANPRNADLPPGDEGLVSRVVRMLGFDPLARGEDLISSTRFHRLLRRGRKYGAQPTIEEALDVATPLAESGLHFVSIGANIARQFEFVQGAWLMSAKFDGVNDERDPLIGHRLPGPDGCPVDHYSIPQDKGPALRLDALPDFVTVVGGAYFFLPGIRALRYLMTSPSTGAA